MITPMPHCNISTIPLQSFDPPAPDNTFGREFAISCHKAVSDNQNIIYVVACK